MQNSDVAPCGDVDDRLCSLAWNWILFIGISLIFATIVIAIALCLNSDSHRYPLEYVLHLSRLVHGLGFSYRWNILGICGDFDDCLCALLGLWFPSLEYTLHLSFEP